MAKRRPPLYEPGKQTDAWLKYRINKGKEFVIGGYVPDNPLIRSSLATTKTES